MSKAELRREVRAARRAFVGPLESIDDVLRKIAMELRLAENWLPAFPANAVVASYVSVSDEVSPRLIDGAVLATGRLLAFPKVSGSLLSFRACPIDALEPGYRGILEPSAKYPEVTPAIILVPLVAADLQGNRIGQGGGHYDRTLATLRATGPVTAIGLAWEVQIVPAIPADPWDQPLDWLATPERLVDCRARR